MISVNLELLGLGIGTGISLGVITYILKEKETIALLKEVIEVGIDSKLTADIASASDGIAACVWGYVKSIGQPLKSLGSPEVSGVVRQHTIKEHLVTKARYSSFWNADKRIINKTFECVPFVIQDNGIGFQVLSPAYLQHVDLNIVSIKYDAASTSFFSDISGLIRGVQPTGLEQTERMLFEGTRVMGIGKLVEKNGSFILEACPPLPYYVTTKSKQGVIGDMELPLNLMKILLLLSMGVTSFFIYRLLKRAHKRYKESSIYIGDDEALLEEFSSVFP